MPEENFECYNCLENAIMEDKLEINYSERKLWHIRFCKKCGRVTNIQEDSFNFFNSIPRIGRIKSLFVWGVIGGTAGYLAYQGNQYAVFFVGLIMFIWLKNILSVKYGVVKQCNYRRWGIYPELRGR